jgi:hypothetical protein
VTNLQSLSLSPAVQNLDRVQTEYKKKGTQWGQLRHGEKHWLMQKEIAFNVTLKMLEIPKSSTTGSSRQIEHGLAAFTRVKRKHLPIQ